MSLQAPKGTFDILPYGTNETWMLTRSWQTLETTLRELTTEYGYKEIRTPIYESTELFDRGIGETSDIVSKEMFTFTDRGGRSLSLRPEGTASFLRAALEHRLLTSGSLHKFYYIGPMFRYERPQAGRYRQHHQFGIETIGSGAPEQDAEIIDLLTELYRRIGLQHFTIHLNSVGDLPSRLHFRNALLDYLRPHFSALSPDSQIRFEKNPLRILDSKDPQDQDLIRGAPSILHSLTPDARSHFQTLCHLLDRMQIPYVINDRIIRGLDYYQKTVFEAILDTSTPRISLGGGGRYDGFVKNCGGPDLPGAGFGMGMERLLQVMEAQQLLPSQEPSPFLYIISLGEKEKETAFWLATQLRHAHIAVEIDLLSKKIPAGLQHAAKLGATYAAILGPEELSRERIQLKHLATREQQELELSQCVAIIQQWHSMRSH